MPKYKSCQRLVCLCFVLLCSSRGHRHIDLILACFLAPAYPLTTYRYLLQSVSCADRIFVKTMQHHARRLPNGLLSGLARIFLVSITISISSTTSVAATMTHSQMRTLTLLSRNIAVAPPQTHRQTQTLSSRSAPCQLNCANGGHCEYTGSDDAQLSHDIQSGHLVQKCICLPGFVGMGCEIPSPCGVQDTQCDYCTIVADEMSKFAGMMCRKPFTEYCNAVTATTDFCTNGGKCMASFVAAHLAPGNTTANSQFAGLGCICNPAFYGPHCELLKLPHHTDDPEILTLASVGSSSSGTILTTRDSESDNSSNSGVNSSNNGNDSSNNSNNSNNSNDSNDSNDSSNSSNSISNKSLDLTSAFSLTVLVASVASFLIVVAGSVLIRRSRHQREARRRHLYGRDMPGSGLMRGGYAGSEQYAAEFASLTRAGRNII
jgi:hypothetical protein